MKCFSCAPADCVCDAPAPAPIKRRGAPNEPRVGWFVHKGVKHVVHAGYLKIPNGFPQLNSDDWIEYVAEPRVVERDGDLWWRYYSAEYDTMCELQMTKGGRDARRP